MRRWFADTYSKESVVRIMFDADGYAGKIVDLARTNESIELNVKLEAGGEVSGEVRGLDGHLVAGAEVSFRGPSLSASMTKPGEFENGSRPSDAKARTGADGMFKLHPVPNAERLAVVHNDGWANVDLGTLPGTPIWLQPWSRIEGVVRIGGHPWAKLKIRATTRDLTSSSEQLLYDLYTYTDNEGRFEFPKVSPGAVLIAPLHQGERMGVFTHATIINVQANATAQVIHRRFRRAGDRPSCPATRAQRRWLEPFRATPATQRPRC